jgi:hypothetical protein
MSGENSFIRDARGSVAIEFAVLGPLLLLFVVGFVYFASMALTTLRLNTAVAQAALLLGEDREDVRSEADVRELVCSFAALSDCDSRLEIRVEPLSGFSLARQGAEESGVMAGQALKMKILSARYDTGPDLAAVSRILFGAASTEQINASAMFVRRGG